MDRQQLKRIGTMITDLNRTCDQMRKEIHNAQRESAPMLEEASILIRQKSAVEMKQKVLNAFNEHFIVSEDDLTVLTGSTEPVDDRFFQIMSRIKQIRKDCEVLLGTEDQTLGMELMEQTSRNINAAFKKLYTWIQQEFKKLDLEDPQISHTIRRALRVLAERPTLFQNCLDFFAEAREHALSDAFHTALTESVGGDYTAARPGNPIEMQTHDLLRYVGDMLAWVHSTAVSEREALEGLFISDGDEIAKEIQAGRDSELWAKVYDDEDRSGDSTPTFDGRKALNDLVNRDMEGVARVLKQRIGIAVQSNDDPLLVYKALNLFKFYQDIFFKLVGSPSKLGDTIADLQTSTFSHFERLLQDEISSVATEPLPEDLSTPPFLLRALNQFKSFIAVNPDPSGPEISQLLSTALVPFLDRCSKMSSETSASEEDDSAAMVALNWISVMDYTLRPVLPPEHGFLQRGQQEIAKLREELVDRQHSFLLDESGVERLLDAIRGAESEDSPSPDIASLPVFNAKALSTSAAQLDDFLPSALMDMLENMDRLSDKTLAKDIAHEAGERFCADFEVVEEAILRADEELQHRRRGAEDGVDEVESEEVLLREMFPRTTVETRVLLS
jgi:conserved oligomeric Golgi complex subunit 6